MKKLIVIIIGCIVASTTNAQSNLMPLDPCPPGYCPSVYWEVQVFNFHKPRTQCQSGFGLCIRLAPGQLTCRLCSLFQGSGTSITGTIATVLATMVNNKIELHIPIGIRDDAGFKGQEMSTFTIDQDMINIVQGDKKIWKAKAGEYPVTKTTTEYIILIDFE